MAGDGEIGEVGFWQPLSYPFPWALMPSTKDYILVFASTQGVRNAFHLHCRKETDKGNETDESFVKLENNKIVI